MSLKILSTRTVLECSVFDVEKSVVQQDGLVYQREIVRHPGSAVIVPLFDDGTVALVEQYRHAAGKSLLELPAGSLEKNETPTECASREIVEEIGFAAGKLEKLTEFFVSPGFLTEKMHVFLATGLKPAEGRPDFDEVINVHRIKLDVLAEMVHRNEIADAKSMVGILLTFSRIRSAL